MNPRGNFVLSISLLLAVATCAYAKNQSALEEGEVNVAHWNGLDYEYGMFDHSGEDPQKKNETIETPVTSNKTLASMLASRVFDSYEYSDESDWWGDSYEDDYSMEHGHHNQHDKITIGYDEATTVKAAPSVSPKATERAWREAVTTPRLRGSTKESNPRLSTPQEIKDGDYWNEDEGDEDDGMMDNDKEQNKKVSSLPTDNDNDADKYFNPDKYQEQIRLHHIADLVSHTWTVQYENSHLPCIMLRGDIKLVVPVNPTWFNKDHVDIDVPHDAEASGTCNTLNNDYQEIILKWNVSIPGRKVYQNSVYFGFATNFTSEFSEMKIPEDKYALVAVTVVYYNGEIGNGDDGLVSYSVSDLVKYMTPINMSMSCFKDNQGMMVGDMQLSLSNMQLEAFRPNLDTLTVGEFSRSVLCDSDEIYVFDAVMTYIIWFWIAALLVILLIFVVLLSLGYRRRRCPEGNGGFGYKVLSA